MGSFVCRHSQRYLTTQCEQMSSSKNFILYYIYIKTLYRSCGIHMMAVSDSGPMNYIQIKKEQDKKRRELTGCIGEHLVIINIWMHAFSGNMQLLQILVLKEGDTIGLVLHPGTTMLGTKHHYQNTSKESMKCQNIWNKVIGSCQLLLQIISK